MWDNLDMTEEELYFLKAICFLSQYKEYSGQFRNKISNRKMGLARTYVVAAPGQVPGEPHGTLSRALYGGCLCRCLILQINKFGNFSKVKE